MKTDHPGTELREAIRTVLTWIDLVQDFNDLWADLEGDPKLRAALNLLRRVTSGRVYGYGSPGTGTSSSARSNS